MWLCGADGVRFAALPLGFMLEESLIDFVFNSQKGSFSEKIRYPAETILLQGSSCVLLQCYDNYKYMAFFSP